MMLRYLPERSSHECVVFEAMVSTTVREALFDLGLSRAAVGRLAARSQLMRNHKAASGPESLAIGDVVAVKVQAERPGEGGGPARSTTSHPLRSTDILFEDQFMLVVSKPAGLLVHGDGTKAPTLTGYVQDYLSSTGMVVKAQAVQRLDVDTTGAVLFSKTEEFQCLFDALVAGGAMGKCYLAVAQGIVPSGIYVLSDPIARDRHDARRMRVVERGGQQARTQVERLAVARDGSCSLLRVALGTGRRHQIRVHLAAQGHPLVGDALYGYRGPQVEGLMLHAYEESFAHPITGAPLRVCAGWPQRFSRWFDEGILGVFAGEGNDGHGARP